MFTLACIHYTYVHVYTCRAHRHEHALTNTHTHTHGPSRANTSISKIQRTRLHAQINHVWHAVTNAQMPRTYGTSHNEVARFFQLFGAANVTCTVRPALLENVRNIVVGEHFDQRGVFRAEACAHGTNSGLSPAAQPHAAQTGRGRYATRETLVSVLRAGKEPLGARTC